MRIYGPKKGEALLCVCVFVYVCMYVCMYVQLSARRLVGSPYSTGTRYAQTHTPMHTQAHTHKYTYSTPHTTTARRTKPGVEWGRVRVMKSRRMR
jgi:hypothetical protein